MTHKYLKYFFAANAKVLVVTKPQVVLMYFLIYYFSILFFFFFYCSLTVLWPMELRLFASLVTALKVQKLAQTLSLPPANSEAAFTLKVKAKLARSQTLYIRVFLRGRRRTIRGEMSAWQVSWSDRWRMEGNFSDPRFTCSWHENQATRTHTRMQTMAQRLCDYTHAGVFVLGNLLTSCPALRIHCGCVSITPRITPKILQ